MGRRVKKEIQTVKVDTDNPIIKRLEALGQHRINVALGWEKPTEEEKRDLEVQQKWMKEWDKSFEQIKDNRFFKRGKWMDDIAMATHVSAIDVSKMAGDYWGFPSLSDEELEQAARDANNIYQEKEIDLNFDSKLQREQVGELLPELNELVFAEVQSVDDVMRLMECRLGEPVKVRSNAIAAYMMYLFSVGGWICQNWQLVADEKEIFASSKGKILRQKDFSKAMSVKMKSLGYPVGRNGVYIMNERLFDAVMRLKR